MIIGIKEENNVILAFSSCDAYVPIMLGDMTLQENVGLWKIKSNPHTVMGCVFPTAESDAYRYEEKMFAGEINYDRLLCEIVPAMEKFADGKDYIGNEDGKYEEFLIAQSGRLFMITTGHIICEIDSTIVIGVNDEPLPKSVLYATDGEPTLDRIIKAFEFFSRERQCDCYPISVIDTATGKMRIITRDRT